MLHRAGSKWLDEFVREHGVFRRPLNALLLSASSSYMLGEKEPFEQVLPLYMEFKDAFISHHERNEEALAILADLLGSFPKRRMLIRELEDIHLTIEYRFKDLVKTLTYITEGWGRDLASRAAVHHEAMEDHIEYDEKVLIPEILDALLKAGASERKISQAFENIEHGRMHSLADRVEKSLSDTVLKSGAVAMNIIGLDPYERHTAIKEKIREIKDEKIYMLILTSDHDHIPHHHRLLNTEPCLNQNFSRTEQVSNGIWISMITLREGCK
ncbi:MAG: hemerythrin domain-containing protein [Sulfolobales archaeon]